MAAGNSAPATAAGAEGASAPAAPAAAAAAAAAAPPLPPFPTFTLSAPSAHAGAIDPAAAARRLVGDVRAGVAAVLAALPPGATPVVSSAGAGACTVTALALLVEGLWGGGAPCLLQGTCAWGGLEEEGGLLAALACMQRGACGGIVLAGADRASTVAVLEALQGIAARADAAAARVWPLAEGLE